ncbi:MAG: amino acid ABC transporter permease [Spirochaetales bacterium]|nr:amino acid ABC transporter permease [Spirochaetales bacterium]
MESIIYNFFNVEVMIRARYLLWLGLQVTLKLAFVSLLFAVLVGLFLAVIRSLRIRFLDVLIIIYVDLFRALPTIVLFMLVYFTWPYFGISLPRYWSAVVALTINGGAYFEEIFRAGIESIDKGQTEAARALGLSFTQTTFSVILPQSIQVVLPPATSNALELIKTTVLASVIALPELMKQAQQAHGSLANPTPLIMAALIFLVLLWPLVRLTGYLERRFAK